jgi:putative endonuclease
MKINNKIWWLYVVRCCDDSLYTGISTNVERRVREHNYSKRGAKYTRARRPVELVWSKKYNNRSEAQTAEFNFKKLFHKEKWEIINENV